MTAASTIEQFTKSDRRKAEALLARVEALLDSTRQTQETLYRNFAEIGAALLAVRNAKAWLLTPAHSWDAYITECQKKFGRSRNTLYGYTAVAERVLPAVGEKTLVSMGISRAMPLARYAKAKGSIPQEIINQAITSKVDEFESIVAEAVSPEPETKGTWLNLGSIKVTPEERSEIDRAFEVAVRVDPPIPQDYSDSARKKAILTRLCQEFLATYESQVLAGQA